MELLLSADHFKFLIIQYALENLGKSVLFSNFGPKFLYLFVVFRSHILYGCVGFDKGCEMVYYMSIVNGR